MNRRLFLVTAALATGLLLAGCSHVAPYQREQLAKPGMDVQERQAMRGHFIAHVYDAREGALAPSEHAGGGCGCN